MEKHRRQDRARARAKLRELSPPQTNGFDNDAEPAVAVESEAQRAWRVEAARVEDLRKRFAADMPVWIPPGPNEPVRVRPSWLMAAQQQEAGERAIEQRAQEMEERRLSRTDITRGEWEGLLRLLGVSSTERARAQSYAAAHEHIRRVNSRDVDRPLTAEQIRRLDEVNAESRRVDAERRAANEKRWREQEAAREAAETGNRAGRAMIGSGNEGFERKGPR
jgi:hypothetical protein